jgi:hypothetical protein
MGENEIQPFYGTIPFLCSVWIKNYHETIPSMCSVLELDENGMATSCMWSSPCVGSVPVAPAPARSRLYVRGRWWRSRRGCEWWWPRRRGSEWWWPHLLPLDPASACVGDGCGAGVGASGSDRAGWRWRGGEKGANTVWGWDTQRDVTFFSPLLSVPPRPADLLGRVRSASEPNISIRETSSFHPT